MSVEHQALRSPPRKPRKPLTKPASSSKERTSWCRKLPGGCAGKAAAARAQRSISPLPHGAKCLVPLGTDAGLCRTRINAAGLHYVRVAKSGSTSLVEAMQAAQAESRACAKRLVLHSLHEVTATHVERAAGVTPPPRSFVVLREPCARLVSLYHFMRASPPTTDWSWSLRATSSPLAWATLLLRNASLRESAIRNSTDDGRWRLSRHRQPAQPVPHYVHYLAAASSAYLTNRTDVACFGHGSGAGSSEALGAAEVLRQQVQRILDRRVGVGTCVLPAVRTRLPEKGRGTMRGTMATTGAARGVDRYARDRTPELCSLAAELYPKDVELWSRRCTNKVR